MPRVVLAPLARLDLERLRQFLATKNPAASRRAANAIVDAIKGLAAAPDAYRPVLNMPHHREIVIKFGASGYIARYFYEGEGNIVVLRVKHELEGELP
jgi:plasmid stabilization system protein ParE